MIIRTHGSPCPARVRPRVSAVTRRRPTETHGRPHVSARILPAAAFAVLAALPGRGAAEPRPLDAKVVWARAERVYVAAPDSVALAPGDLLTLARGKKTVATAEVVQVLTRDLAAARLTSGSLERARLDRLRVLAERPPLLPLALLRIGYPGSGRASLLFACGGARPRPPHAAFRTDSLAENAYRFVRTGETPGAPWPDTILARLFGESADEEIALERGELDVAVFWPGEASSRLRADPRWQALAYGARGVLAAVAPAGSTPATGPAALSPNLAPLAALGDEMFRGDLAPWRDSGASPAPPAPQPAPAGLRFVVDPSCPGRATIERFLARVSPGAEARRDSAIVRLIYQDSPARPPDSLRVTPLFVVRCAVAFEPGLRAHVAALGTDAIVGMLECGAGGRAP